MYGAGCLNLFLSVPVCPCGSACRSFKPTGPSKTLLDELLPSALVPVWRGGLLDRALTCVAASVMVTTPLDRKTPPTCRDFESLSAEYPPCAVPSTVWHEQLRHGLNRERWADVQGGTAAPKRCLAMLSFSRIYELLQHKQWRLVCTGTGMMAYAIAQPTSR